MTQLQKVQFDLTFSFINSITICTSLPSWGKHKQMDTYTCENTPIPPAFSDLKNFIAFHSEAHQGELELPSAPWPKPWTDTDALCCLHKQAVYVGVL